MEAEPCDYDACWACCASCGSIFPAAIYADNLNWICPSATGKYEDSANWDKGTVPSAADLMFVYKGSDATPDDQTCIIDAATQASYNGNAVPAHWLFSGWGTTGTSTINISADVTVMDLLTAGYHQSTGTINQTAGVVNVYASELGWQGGLWVGDQYDGNSNSAGSGVYNLSGSAVLNVNNAATFAIGAYNAGTFNQSGGTVNTTNVDLGWNPSQTADPASTKGIYNISAGTLNASNRIGVGSGGWAAVNISGTGSVSTYDMIFGWPTYNDTITSALSVQGGSLTVSDKMTLGAEANVTATVSQSGGTVSIAQMDRGPGTSSYSLTGGALSLGDGYGHTVGAFQITGGTVSAGSTGTLTADSYDVQGGTVNAILAGAGNLVKSGSATATLNAANTYTGPTTISGGALVLRRRRFH